ncbi:MAG: hypothetical protein JRN68_11140 [Nitrososphaerota archaeon]|jgi:uncharacterized membrane protein|nr:hypothetical protein [Nitrososphaerota archaeon]
MSIEVGIVLAALGITTLELVEASAVGLTLYHTSKRMAVFGAVIAGTVVVLVPTFAVGKAIALLPVFYVRLIAAALLLYFGLRLARSARRAVLRTRTGGFQGEEESHRSLMVAGFSVGMVEAFEAAIVLVALIPVSFDSTVIGLSMGVLVVIVATLVLQSQVRKIKQASMKIVVSALLLSFSVFWGLESVVSLDDLFLIPFFLVFAIVVYTYSHMSLPPAGPIKQSKGAEGDTPSQAQ